MLGRNICPGSAEIVIIKSSYMYVASGLGHLATTKICNDTCTNVLALEKI